MKVADQSYRTDHVDEDNSDVKRARLEERRSRLRRAMAFVDNYPEAELSPAGERLAFLSRIFERNPGETDVVPHGESSDDSSTGTEEWCILPCVPHGWSEDASCSSGETGVRRRRAFKRALDKERAPTDWTRDGASVPNSVSQVRYVLGQLSWSWKAELDQVIGAVRIRDPGPWSRTTSAPRSLVRAVLEIFRDRGKLKELDQGLQRIRMKVHAHGAAPSVVLREDPGLMEEVSPPPSPPSVGAAVSAGVGLAQQMPPEVARASVVAVNENYVYVSRAAGMGKDIIDVFDAIKVQLGSSMFARDASTFLFELMRFYVATDIPSRMLCILSLCRLECFGMLARPIVKAILHKLTQLVEGGGAVEVHALDTADTGAFEQLLGWRKISKDVLGSDIATGIAHLGVMFYATTMFASFPDGVKSVLNATRQVVSSVRVDADWGVMVLDLFLAIGGNIQAAMKSGNWRDLIGHTPAVSWMNMYNAERRLYDAYKRSSGVYDVPERLRVLEALWARGSKLVDEDRTISIAPTVLLLLTFINDVKRLLVEGRAKPFGLIMSGPPGCGKTMMTEALCALVKNIKGVPDNINCTYIYDPALSFQEPRGTVVNLVLNDFPSQKEESLPTPVVPLLQMFVDTTTLLFNRASLQGKADAEEYPSAVFVSTNASVFACTRSLDPSKLDRRYMALQFSYTPAAVAAALEFKIPIDKLLERKGAKDGWVKYSFGYMKNAEPTLIKFGVVTESFSTTSSSEMLLHLRDVMAEAIVKAEFDHARRASVNRCPLGFALDEHSSRCPCLKVEAPVTGDPSRQPVAVEGWVDVREGAISRCVAIDAVVRGAWEELRPRPKYTLFEVSLMLFREFWIFDPAWGRLWDWRLNIARKLGMAFVAYWWALPWFLPLLCELALVFMRFDEFVECRRFPFRPESTTALGMAIGGSVALLFLAPVSGCMELYAYLADGESRGMLTDVWKYQLRLFQESPYSFGAFRCVHTGLTQLGLIENKSLRVGATGLLAGLLVVFGLSKLWAKHRDVHGTIFGRPENMPDSAAPVVPLFRLPATPWLGIPEAAPRPVVDVIISRRGVKMHGVLLDRDILLAPSHFLYAIPGFDACPAREGERCEGVYNGATFAFIFNDAYVTRVAGDSVLIRVPGIMNWDGTRVVVAEAFTGGPVRVGSVNATGTTFAHLLYGVAFTPNPWSRGDCGYPILNEAGEIVGLYGGACGPEGVGPIVLRGAVAQARARLGAFVTPHAYLDGMPWSVKELGKVVPGLHERSDAAHVHLVSPLPLCVVGHVASTSKVTMTGEATVLEPFFRGRCKEYVRPNPGHAKFLNGEWRSIATNKIAGMRLVGAVDYGVLALSVESVLSTVKYDGPAVGYITRAQSFAGDHDNAYINGRDTTKAIGRVLQAQGLNPASAVEQRGTEYRVHPAVLRAMDDYEAALLVGVPRTRVSAVVKNEMISVAAYEKGKGRYFWVCGLECNQVMRVRTLNIISHIMAHPLQMEVFAGTNAGSIEWRALYDYITRDGELLEVMETDQSAYDTHHGVMIEGYVAVMTGIGAKLGYTPDELVGVERVLLSAFYSLTDFEGNYYATSTMLASGRADTIIMNSVTHRLLYHYAFHAYYAARGEETPVSPASVLRLALVGDDSLVSVQPGYAWFTPLYCCAVFEGLGYALTSAHKDVPLGPFVAITAATFMKRGFAVEGERVFAPLAVESIYKSLCYWIPGAVSESVRNAATLGAAQREFFLHGKAAFDSFQEDLDKLPQDACERLTYAGLLSEFDSGTFRVWA